MQYYKSITYSEKECLSVISQISQEELQEHSLPTQMHHMYGDRNMCLV